ncbi:MAG: GNAT family N-acetyltransferase [Chloroflexota bacterium]
MTRQDLYARIQNYKISKLIRGSKTTQLKSGKVRIETLSAEHEADLFHIYSNLSRESCRARFNCDLSIFSDDFLVQLSKQSATLKPSDGYGLIAYDDQLNQPIAVAQYVKIGSHAAEFALTVADDYQGRGLGTLLLSKLVAQSKKEGLQYLEAAVSSDNRGMHLLLMKSGLAQTIDYLNGTMMYKLYLTGYIC